MGEAPIISKLMQGFTPTFGKFNISPIPKGYNFHRFRNLRLSSTDFQIKFILQSLNKNKNIKHTHIYYLVVNFIIQLN